MRTDQNPEIGILKDRVPNEPDNDSIDGVKFAYDWVSSFVSRYQPIDATESEQQAKPALCLFQSNDE
jgi:hypothetical protein